MFAKKKIFVKIEVDFVAKKMFNICISNDPRTLKIAKVFMSKSNVGKNPRKFEFSP